MEVLTLRYLDGGEVKEASLRPRLRAIAEWEVAHSITVFGLMRELGEAGAAPAAFLERVTWQSMLDLLQRLTTKEVAEGVERLAEEEGIVEAIVTPFVKVLLAHIGGASLVRTALTDKPSPSDEASETDPFGR